jgi:hypothetical protein
MAKDIFSDDYFSRHRDHQEWEKVGKRKIDVKKEVMPEIKEEEYDEGPEEIIVRSDPTDYYKMIFAGVTGGFLVLAVQKLGLLRYSIASIEFWMNSGILIIILAIFVILLKIPFNLFRR